MAQLTIKEIYRDIVNTKYGEKQSIKLVPEEETVTDINGDPIALEGRKITGFRDKEGETDKWVKGMKIKVQVTEREGQGREGDTMKWVNFRMPEGTSSIVETPPGDGVVEDPNADVDPDDF